MSEFAVELFDLNGRAIEPGWGGSIYRSPSPLPVPLVGDTVMTMDGEWRVEKRRYTYHVEDNNDTSVLVTLHCRKLGE